MPEELRERLDEVLRDIGYGRLIGVDVLDWEPGRARTRLVPSAEQTNVHGFVHGGAVFAAAHGLRGRLQQLRPRLRRA